MRDPEVREIQLQILEEFHTFCQSREIPYFMYAGTLLGARRHRGFIPWDDDIDLMMLRSDYLRFINEFPATGPFYLANHSNDPTFPMAYTKVCRDGTFALEAGSGQGFALSIDVIPVDSLPRSLLLRKLQSLLFAVARAAMLLRILEQRPGRTALKTVTLTLVRPLLRWIPLQLFTRARETVAIAPLVPKGTLVGMLVTEVYWSLPIEMLTPATMLPFEGRLHPAPADHDALLKRVYGDFMRLPPVERRSKPHNATYYARLPHLP